MPSALRPLFEKIKEAKEKVTLEFPFQPSHRWQQFFIKIKKTHLTFHCLRVTYVNRLRRAGVPREAARILSEIDRSEVRDSVRIGKWDIPEYFKGLRGFVRGFDSFEKLAEQTMDSVIRVESGRHDPAWVNTIIGQASTLWRARTEFLSPEFSGCVNDLTREYLIWLSKHPDALDSIGWHAFERLVAEIFASRGFTVELTARTPGSSADVIAVSLDRFGIATKYLIECKCNSSSRKVGLGIVNAVLGAKERSGCYHALLVTTSSFTGRRKRRRVPVARPAPTSEGWCSRPGVATRNQPSDNTRFFRGSRMVPRCALAEASPIRAADHNSNVSIWPIPVRYSQEEHSRSPPGHVQCFQVVQTVSLYPFDGD